MELGRRFILGLIAGTIASTVNIPFDVAKSRIQGPQPETGIKYKTCLQTIRLVFKEEGFVEFSICGSFVNMIILKFHYF